MSKGQPLEALRKRLDKIDVALHELLVERAEISLSVAEAKREELTSGRTAMRPAREAEMMRRLLAREHGALPPRSVHRIWREIVGASAWLQAPFTVAVAGGKDAAAAQTAALSLYGAAAPILQLQTPQQVLRSLATGRAQIGVLPEPASDDWWLQLLELKDIRIAGRLPFLRESEAVDDSFVMLGALDIQPSGADQSFLALISQTEISAGSVTRQLEKAGLPGRRVAGAARGGVTIHLAEIDDFVAANDPRLDVLAAAMDTAPPVLLGAFPTPLILNGK